MPADDGDKDREDGMSDSEDDRVRSRAYSVRMPVLDQFQRGVHPLQSFLKLKPSQIRSSFEYRPTHFTPLRLSAA